MGYVGNKKNQGGGTHRLQVDLIRLKSLRKHVRIHRQQGYLIKYLFILQNKEIRLKIKGGL
jgi:hypothetical protein